MYTLLMYLNSPDEGGETHFPDLNLTVAPATGRALLWPSLMDADVRSTELFTFLNLFPSCAGSSTSPTAGSTSLTSRRRAPSNAAS